MTIQDSAASMMLMMDNNNGGGMSCLPCTPLEEKQIVRRLNDQSELDLKEGNLFYLISSRWYKSWERYVGVGGDQVDSHHLVNGGGGSVERPGPIDNSDLIENGGNGGDGGDVELRRNLEEAQDYVLVPQQVWEKLFHWYLCAKTYLLF